MDVTKGNIFGILNGYKQFSLPIYQRCYSWGIEHCTTLWNDIVKMQKANKTGHFVGSIVNIAETAMPMGVQRFNIIDGQQRMTTLTLLSIALRDFALQHPGISSAIHAGRIDEMLLMNAQEKGNDRYKLLLTEADRDVLMNLASRVPLTKQNLPSRLLANYKFFSAKIAQGELTPDEVYESIGKLQIVNITLDASTDDAQAIFESLNSTGKDLTASDLIRNYILMGLSTSKQNDLYERLWRPMETLFEAQSDKMDDFFRDYLTMKQTRIPRKDRVYEEFKLYRQTHCPGDPDGLCEDLFLHARYYADMFFVRSERPKWLELYRDIRDLKMEVSYPFLMRVHHDCETGMISENDFLEIVRLCISYVFRRGICGIPTNSLNKTFATLRNGINQEDYLNSVKAFFILRESYKEFPDDERFREAFSSKDIYNSRSCHFILGHLENEGKKAPILIDNYTVEHIMPQNSRLSEEWQRMLGPRWREIQKSKLHTIGNLTLTAYNAEMSDHPFDKKQDMPGGFRESALRLNNYVVKQTKWGLEQIEERAQLLAKRACEIWPYPSLDEEVLAPYRTNAADEPEYRLDSYPFNDRTRALYDVLHQRILNLSSDVRCDFTKRYIAYKLDTNFADVIVTQKYLRICVNMKFADVHDPHHICRDTTGVSAWGNGDVEVNLHHADEMDKVMDIISQSYQLQATKRLSLPLV